MLPKPVDSQCFSSFWIWVPFCKHAVLIVRDCAHRSYDPQFPGRNASGTACIYARRTDSPGIIPIDKYQEKVSSSLPGTTPIEVKTREWLTPEILAREMDQVSTQLTTIPESSGSAHAVLIVRD